jgi:hypothetical protein
MLDPVNGMPPGEPPARAARMFDSVAHEPAPLRMVLGSQALANTLTGPRGRIADFRYPDRPGRSGDQNTLTKWISAIDADLPALRSLTTGLCRDRPSTGDLTIAHRRPGPRPVSEAETPGPAGKLKTAHPRKTPS